MSDKLEIARRCADAMWDKDKASQALGIEVNVPNAGVAIAKMHLHT